jgi:hypothetical protein
VVNELKEQYSTFFFKSYSFDNSSLFIGAAITECWQPGNAVFETCKITLPTLATFVIGYYFGSTKYEQT